MTLHATDNPVAESTTWLTPLWLVDSLGKFDLDPCGFPGHKTAGHLICLPDDGLIAEWSGRVWLNPPYGREAKTWLEKLQSHGDGVALIFGRLETKWLQPFLTKGFFQIQGRLHFISDREGFKGNAGTGNILIPFGRKNLGAILMSDIPGRWYQ